MCYVLLAEAKGFVLIFSEGKGVVGGWNLLAQKLRKLWCDAHYPCHEVPFG